MRYPNLPQGKPRMRERGQGLVEYSLLLVLVGVVVVLILSLFGKEVQQSYCRTALAISPDVDAPFCEMIDVSCAAASSPFRLEAVVSDRQGEDNVDRVEFFVDGALYNTEYNVKYCLHGGDASCQAFPQSGQHTFKAVAYDADGNTGSCSITATVP